MDGQSQAAHSEFGFIVKGENDETYGDELSLNSRQYAASQASTSPRTRRLPSLPKIVNHLRVGSDHNIPPPKSPMTVNSDAVRNNMDRYLNLQPSKQQHNSGAAAPADLESQKSIRLGSSAVDSALEHKKPETPTMADDKKSAGVMSRICGFILDYRKYLNLVLVALLLAVFAAVAYTVYRSVHKSSSPSSTSSQTEVTAVTMTSFYLASSDSSVTESSLESSLQSILGTSEINVSTVSSSAISLVGSFYPYVFNVSVDSVDAVTILQQKLAAGDAGVSAAKISALVTLDGSISLFVPASSSTAQPTAAPSATTANTDGPTQAPTLATDSPTSAPSQQPTDSPTSAPTSAPTDAPTAAPTDAPTDVPTEAPTDAPTDAPTAGP